MWAPILEEIRAVPAETIFVGLMLGLVFGTGAAVPLGLVLWLVL